MKKRHPQVDVRRAPGPAPARPMIPVGRTDDPAERHADALAERALAVAGTYSIRRSAGSAPEGLQVDPAALARAGRGGSELDPTVRRSLEPGLGSSLDHVRVHTGGEAASMAAQMGAAASPTATTSISAPASTDRARPTVIT